MDKYTCILIDDDAFSRETLEDLIRETPELRILKSLSQSAMAIKYLATLQPDIAFLDINMPQKSGIDIQKEINDLQLKTKVIFITSHDEFLVEAFKNKAFDYLVKPVKKTDFNETLERFFKQNSKQNLPQTVEYDLQKQSEILIKNAYGSLILKSNDIFYIEADGSYSKIFLVHGNTEIISKNIGKIEYLFPKEHFFKISRSHIINLKYLSKTDRINKTITLSFNNKKTQLKVSREKLYNLEQIL